MPPKTARLSQGSIANIERISIRIRKCKYPRRVTGRPHQTMRSEQCRCGDGGARDCSHSRPSFAADQAIRRQIAVRRQHRVARDVENFRQRSCRGQPRSAGDRTAMECLRDLPIDLTIQGKIRCPVQHDRRYEEVSAVHDWPFQLALFILNSFRRIWE